jgi:hypothetical protein
MLLVRFPRIPVLAELAETRSQERGSCPPSGPEQLLALSDILMTVSASSGVTGRPEHAFSRLLCPSLFETSSKELKPRVAPFASCRTASTEFPLVDGPQPHQWGGTATLPQLDLPCNWGERHISSRSSTPRNTPCTALDPSTKVTH